MPIDASLGMAIPSATTSVPGGAVPAAAAVPTFGGSVPSPGLPSLPTVPQVSAMPTMTTPTSYAAVTPSFPTTTTPGLGLGVPSGIPDLSSKNVYIPIFF